MKFLTIREFRANTAEVRKSLEKEKEIVVTANGKPFAILMPVTSSDLEGTLLAIRRARFAKALEDAHAAARESGLAGMSMGEIDDIVSRTREKRKRRPATA